MRREGEREVDRSTVRDRKGRGKKQPSCFRVRKKVVGEGGGDTGSPAPPCVACRTWHVAVSVAGDQLQKNNKTKQPPPRVLIRMCLETAGVSGGAAQAPPTLAAGWSHRCDATVQLTGPNGSEVEGGLAAVVRQRRAVSRRELRGGDKFRGGKLPSL